MMTMAALEHVLDKNPEPLRQFSARRDFSGGTSPLTPINRKTTRFQTD